MARLTGKATIDCEDYPISYLKLMHRAGLSLKETFKGIAVANITLEPKPALKRSARRKARKP